MTTVQYDGQLPVDEETYAEWQEQGVERIRWAVPTDVSTLIDIGGLDHFSDWLDEIFGYIVSNFSYGIVRTADPDDQYGDDGFLLWVECDLPPFD